MSSLEKISFTLASSWVVWFSLDVVEQGISLLYRLSTASGPSSADDHVNPFIRRCSQAFPLLCLISIFILSFHISHHHRKGTKKIPETFTISNNEKKIAKPGVVFPLSLTFQCRFFLSLNTPQFSAANTNTHQRTQHKLAVGGGHKIGNSTALNSINLLCASLHSHFLLLFSFCCSEKALGKCSKSAESGHSCCSLAQKRGLFWWSHTNSALFFILFKLGSRIIRCE